MRNNRAILGLTANVFFLGVVSLLTDMSSEMTLTILPLFLANVLGAGTPVIGLIEGLAESAATMLKIISGWMSDRWGNRKNLTAIGYALSSLSKPLLYFANAWGLVLGIRITDRIGKGIRSSPRDALLADSTPENIRGKSFGFHRAMDSAGAVIGLSLAALIVFLMQRNEISLERSTYQNLVLVGVIPGLLAVLILWFMVKEIKKDKKAQPLSIPLKKDPPGKSKIVFSRNFYLFLGVMVLFTLGKSSDAFLILRAQNLGLSTLQILVLLVFFNIVYTLIALPAGILSDKLGRKALISLGWLVYAFIYLGFALASAKWQVLALFVAYGIYYGTVEGVARAYVADLVPADKRGTAFGLFHGAVGLSLLPASIIAGVLWQAINPSAPFFFGAALSFLALVGLLVLVKKPRAIGNG